MVKLSQKGLLVAAGAFSLLTAILLYAFMQEDAAAPMTGTAQKVIVATKDIAGRTKIAEGDVKIVEVSKDLVQESAMGDLKDVIGMMTKMPIMAGDQIRGRSLALTPGERGLAGAIPLDKRAVTIAINDISGVEGFVQPGDYVDVIAAMQAGESGNVISQVILQDIEVLAIGKNDKAASMPDGVKENAKTATLAVTLDEAERVVLFKGEGLLSLALRPFEAKGRRIVIGRDLVDVMGQGILKGRAAMPQPFPSPIAPPKTPAYAPAVVKSARPASPQSFGGGIAVYRGVHKEVVHPVR